MTVVDPAHPWSDVDAFGDWGGLDFFEGFDVDAEAGVFCGFESRDVELVGNDAG